MFKLSRAAAPAIICLILSACGGAGAPQSAHPPGWGHPPKGAFFVPPPTQSLAGTARMYDTVTLSTVPSNPFATAGYTSGFFVTYLPLRQRFPHAHTVSIAVNTSHHADCLDVEPGDAHPSEVVGWVRADKAAGFGKPCVYSSFFEFVDEIRPLLRRAGISSSQVFEWDADYLGCPRLDATFDATQCTDRAFGRNLDESVVKLTYLSIATPPFRAPAPKPKPKPSRSGELAKLLGAYSKRTNPHGHNCQNPPFRHAYPSVRYNHACAIWAREAA
jgi:hypothetical protein